ncbi:unnamed protein product [Cuscuta campestris]|uniref:Uncharacterized protein n=1 Tax=Cuscuta campestris TaxID=132261 RepID=A0A484MDR4_9ASTE|nr:unnamed protein product [Cuscuta campestris]
MNLDPSDGGRGRESDDGKRLPEEEETAAANEEDDGSWPHFEEEDYIVFCFTEDGEIHVVEDRRSESSSAVPRTNIKLRSLRRRLMYEENGERGYVDEERGDIVMPREKGAFCMEEGEESGRGDGEGAKETICTRCDDDDGGRLESCESRSGQYDHSSASRSSFAFPV